MKKAIPNLYKDLQFNYYRFTVLSSIFSILIVLISFHNLHSQSVYFCNAIDVRVRAENCDDNTSTIYGLVSNPQSYVVLNTQGSSCGGGLNWHEIDIPNAHGTSGYPNTAFVASNYFNISPNPSNYLTVQNSPNGLRVRNTRNGPFTYIINTGFLPNFASFENGQRLARTSTAPVLDGNGIDTWYEIFLTPNCYVNNSTDPS